MREPQSLNTVGPLPFGHVEDVPHDGWRAHVRRIRPDVIYALLNWQAVQTVCDQHDSNREDYTDLLFVLLNLEIWCRLFLDGETASDIAGELQEKSRAA